MTPLKGRRFLESGKDGKDVLQAAHPFRLEVAKAFVMKNFSSYTSRGVKGYQTVELETAWLGGSYICIYISMYTYTLPETNIAPEHGWLEDEVSFCLFQVLC